MNPLTVACAVTLFVSVVPAFAADEPAYHGKSLSHWIAAARDSNADRRREAVQALQCFDPKLQGFLPKVIELLRDSNYSAHLDATYLLVDLARKDRSVIPLLIGSLEHNDSKARTGIARALGCVGQGSAECARGILDRTKDTSADVRAVAAESIGRMKIGSELAVPALILLLKDEARVRSEALSALAEYGPKAKAAVPTLMELLDYDDWDTKWKSRFCLARIGGRAEDVPKLIARLKREGPRVMWGPCAPGGYGSGMARAIKAVGLDAIPFLVQALDDEDSDVRAGAAETIGLFGNPGLSFVAGLDKELKRRDPPQVFPEAKWAVPALTKLLSDKSAVVRVNAALAVWRLHGETERTFPILQAALEDKDPHVRGGAASAIYKMGHSGARMESDAIRQAWNAGPLGHRATCRD